jgi:tripartite-type tricarboxylate transporter receptor subunit TctC
VRRRDLLTLGSALLAIRGLWTTTARASSYPDRPVRLIIPFPPGGGFDAIGRPWADRIKPLLGTIVVENQGGGGSSLGAATVAHSSPDGYTLLLGGSSTHVTEAILKTRPLYDPLKDLEPISNIAVSPFALAVHPSIPATTLAEFIDYDKANRGKLSYGFAQSSHRRIIQVARRSSRSSTGAVSRLGTGHRRRACWPCVHGDARRHRANDRVSPHR